MLTWLDGNSQKFIHRSASRLGWYAVGTAMGWLIFTHHDFHDLAVNGQLVCMIGAIAAILRAFAAGTVVNTPSLTDWDEGLLLNLIGLGIHITLRRLS